MTLFLTRLSRFAAGALALAYAPGCSNNVDVNASAGSTGSGGASAGAGSASSSGGVGSASSSSGGQTPPESPQGVAAWSVTVQNNPNDCAIQGGTMSLGGTMGVDVVPGAQDGVDGAAVDCSVQGSSGGFTVDASATHGPDLLRISNLFIDAGATQASPATGQIAYASAETGATYSGTASFFFDPGSKETVASGKIWVSFTAYVEGDATGCFVIAPSYAVFASCAPGD
jgi:hypothetical protein